MKMFKCGDPVTALQKTRDDLAGLEQTNSGLRATRAQKLVETDELAPIQQLDAALTANERTAAILRERIVVAC